MKNSIIILLVVLGLSCSSEDNNQEQQLNFLEQNDGSVFYRESISTGGKTYIKIVNNESAPLEYYLHLGLTSNECYHNPPFNDAEPNADITIESDLMEISRLMWVDTVLVRTYTVSDDSLYIKKDWYANGVFFLTNNEAPYSISSTNVDTLPLPPCD